MASKSVPLTKEGLTKLQQELDHLVNVRRAEVAQRMHDSKEMVGAQNAPEYEDARNEQASRGVSSPLRRSSRTPS